MVPTFGDHIVDVGQPVWDVWFPSWEPPLELGICGLLQPGNDCRVLENEDYVLHGVDMDVTWVLGLEASETLHNGGTPGDVKPELQGRAVGAATSMASISLGEDGWDAWDDHPQRSSPWFSCVSEVGEKYLEGGPVILGDLEGLVGGPDDSGSFPGKEWVKSLGQRWGKDPTKGGFLGSLEIGAPCKDLESLEECQPNRVLDGEVPTPGPWAVLGVVVEEAKQRGSLLDDVVGLGDPSLEDGDELLTFVGKHSHSEGSGIELPSNHLPKMVVGVLQLVIAECWWDVRVVGSAQDVEEGCHTGTDSPLHKLPNVGIQVVVDVHVVGRGLATPIGVEDPRIEGVPISWAEVGNFHR